MATNDVDILNAIHKLTAPGVARADFADALQDLIAANIDAGVITSEMLEADVIDAGDLVADSVIDSEHIVAGAIDAAHMSANSIDSDSYVDGSIDNAHLAANSVDSDNYVDGSIDTAHYAAGSVDTTALADDNVTNVKLAAPCIRTYKETCPVASFTDNLDATGTLVLGATIPAGAEFLRAQVSAIVGFAGDTSAAMTIGDGTDIDRYMPASTLDVFTTAAQGVAVGVPSGTTFHDSAVSTVTLIITGASDFTSIVTEGNGTVDVTLYWYETI